MVDVLVLPEGLARPGFLSRLFGHGRRRYDALWRYLSPAHPDAASEREGDAIDFVSADQVPSRAHLAQETLKIGRRLHVPFSSVRGLLVGHGLVGSDPEAALDLLVLVEGCDRYLSVHRFEGSDEVEPLVRALAARMHVPLGFASQPFTLLLAPGASDVEHPFGRTPLVEVRGVVAARAPDGQARVRLLTDEAGVMLFSGSDPDGRIERAALVASDVFELAGRRFREELAREG
ncbi:MAG: hypothetical protein PHU25_00175 [Deltaproteobacteria bacterium]|nr:hypothetical protein [Deltaproteobacteria bacterium]